MRRILIERARGKKTSKRGGAGRRLDLDEIALPADERSERLLALDEALAELEQHDAPAANLVKLRYFAGLTLPAWRCRRGRAFAARLWGGGKGVFRRDEDLTFAGQTAPRTNAVIDSALDGILFIDEAYGLVKEHEDYGQEAIETLLKRMEDDRDRLIVIVAGYPEEMDRFIHSNPGLQSRFNRFIEFPDYTPQELCRIFALMCRKNGLTLTPASKEKVLHHFAYLHKERGENFGNARLARNCFEAVINAQASRLAASGTFDARALTVLEAQDLKTPAQDSLEEYRKGRKGYIVKCTNCNQVYSWSPDLDIIDAICTRCGKTYNCEFGEPLP